MDYTYLYIKLTDVRVNGISRTQNSDDYALHVASATQTRMARAWPPFTHLNTWYSLGSRPSWKKSCSSVRATCWFTVHFLIPSMAGHCRTQAYVALALAELKRLV